MNEFSQFRRPLFAIQAIAVMAVMTVISVPVLAANGSLWIESSARLLLADNRARNVGDILTIVVEETNESAKQNNTKTAKKTGISASISSFLFGAGQDGFLTRGGKYPSMDMKSDKSFEGGGTINNSERITARIAVRVTEVLPNGHMILEGRRMTLVGGEERSVKKTSSLVTQSSATTSLMPPSSLSPRAWSPTANAAVGSPALSTKLLLSDHAPPTFFILLDCVRSRVPDLRTI